MNSTSFSPPLQTFTKKHVTKSRSHQIQWRHRNSVTPNLYHCTTSKYKIEPMHPKPLLFAALGGTNNPVQEPPPPVDLIHKFYTYLNNKDVRELEKLIDPTCVIEDKAYYEPLEGKKVHKFFEKLTGAMGRNVVFAIDRICDGDESSIVVLWHLEWNGEVIPFTKGCSFYTCAKNNQTFLINKAYIFVEAPLKPGDFALDMLKIMIALFDRFPKLAKGFLRKTDMMVFYMLKLYKVVVKPLMLPLIIYYKSITTYSAKIVGTVLMIINSILQLFF